MVYLYVGMLGSGKTLMALDCMLGYMGRGAIVTTNIALKFDACRDLCRSRWRVLVDSSQYKRLDDNETYQAHKYVVPGTPEKHNLLVIDECQFFFPARGYQATANRAKEFLEFLVMSRHLCVDVILIIQHPNNLDAMLRRVAQFEVLHRDLRKYPVPWLGWKPLSWIHILSVVTFETGGTEPIDKHLHPVDTKLYACYDTLEMKFPFQMAEGDASKFKKETGARVWVSHYLKLVLMSLTLVSVLGCSYYDKKNYQRMTNECQQLINQLKEGKPIDKKHGPSFAGYFSKQTKTEEKEEQRKQDIVSGYNLKEKAYDICFNGVWLSSGEYVPGYGLYMTYNPRQRLVAFMQGKSLKMVQVLYKAETQDNSTWTNSNASQN